METIFKAEDNVLTVIRAFNANLELVWKTWTEAELLDKWWAPQPWKSVTKSMDFGVGGQRLYAMVGPNGEEHWGCTKFRSIKPQVSFSGEDVFCDDQGNVNPELPAAVFENVFTESVNSTTVTITTTYALEQHLQQVIEMGMKEGLTMALENLDEVLKELSC